MLPPPEPAPDNQATDDQAPGSQAPDGRPAQADSRELAALLGCLAPRAALSLALVHGATHTFHTHGRTAGAAGAPVTPDTAFELGSVSKTFTALLLAESVARGELRYEQTIDTLLTPRHRPVPRRGGPITLLHLATHTSGLPRLPPGLPRRALPRWWTNPYEAFSPEQLMASLGRTRVRSYPGSRVRYSNFGVGLLGRLLADAANTDYPDLLAERICAPLGLTGTGCAPNPRSQAIGHARGRDLPPWRIPALPGAGAIRSTGRDLALLLRAHLAAAGSPRPDGTSLHTALREVQRPRLAVPRGGDRLGLVWNLRRRGEVDLLFHSGATRGFTAFVGFAPRTGVGLAALTNQAPTLDGRFIQAAYELLKSPTVA
ncbi:beta-lactamase family protein [Kitasatospora sp. NBC_01287]|uniref:serine hydrolase domain-containing protein n=1 Tax=Kitasatospora sp. NBC_01287 TaxID=2903573 RepID=UPI0022514C6B|nr:serine hydrolase domain-containing protein [Kitasatospora sp. NBC_01287]MCX4744019.1 beta-lactamase family protein [Kitasatospora sp. NBC_01287]